MRFYIPCELVISLFMCLSKANRHICSSNTCTNVKKRCWIVQAMNLMIFYIPCMLVFPCVRPLISVFVQDKQTHAWLECIQKRNSWSAIWQAMKLMRFYVLVISCVWPLIFVFVFDEHTH